MAQVHRISNWLPGLAAAAMLVSASAAAQTLPAGGPGAERPAVTTEVRTQIGASYNNPGLQQSLEWSARRLLRPGARALFADAHLSTGAQAVVSPSYARLNLWAQYAPLSVVTLRVGVEPAQYFGTFDSLMSFERQDLAFDNDTRRDRGGAGPGRALRLYVTPTLRARAGAWSAQLSGDVERWSASDGPWFYEPTRDTLLQSKGSTLMAARTVVLREHVSRRGTRVGLGAIHTLQQVNRGRLNQVQRVGALTTVQSDGRWRWLRRPAGALVVARYLDDPSKDGGWTAMFTLATTLRER